MILLKVPKVISANRGIPADFLHLYSVDIVFEPLRLDFGAVSVQQHLAF